MLSVIEKVNDVVNNFIWGVPAMICIICDEGYAWQDAQKT